MLTKTVDVLEAERERIEEYYANGDMSTEEYKEALLKIRLNELMVGKFKAIKQELLSNKENKTIVD